MLTIHEAISKHERQAVYGLRYEIYVEEMKRAQQWADDQQRTICEPLDEYSRIFYACEDDRIAGTIRTTFASDGALECEALYGLDCFPGLGRHQVSMTTKLMVRAEYRQQSTLAAHLAMHVFDHNVEHGIRLDFIDANLHLVPFYSKMGYRCYRRDINHPEYGPVAAMVLAMDDVSYLEGIRSPFRRIARKTFGDGPYLGADAFYGALSNGKRQDQVLRMWVPTLSSQTLARVA